MASYTLHIQYVDRPAETRTFTQAKVSLGRDSGDIVLHDTQVSGKHGEILFDGSTLRYTDVGSTNGSFLLQGQRVANIELTPGIALRLGNSLITVQVIDAPNVAGKGRTVIAGPGMAPGFPAPMRPPGPIPGGAPATGPAGAPLTGPRPGMPFPAPVAAPAPGAFAFAPTAQMQSPVAAAGMPAPPAPQAGAFVPQPPAPMAPPSPMAPQYPAPPQHLAPPQPFAPQPGAPITQPPGQPIQPLQPLQPMPVGAAPQPPPMAPPGPPPGTLPPQSQQPIAQAPAMMPVAPIPSSLPAPIEGDAPVGAAAGLDVKTAALNAWEAIQPHIVPATLITAILSVPMAVVGWLVLISLGPLGFGGILLLLLALAQMVGSLIVFPALIRFVIGVHLGQPQDVQVVIRQQVADLKVNAPNFIVFGLIAAIAAIFLIVPAIFVAAFIGPIFFVEGKRMMDAITRNVDLVKRDPVPVIVNILVVAVVGAIGLGIVGAILGFLPAVGGLLGALVRAIGQSILSPIVLMLTTQMYFQYRRRFEGGDPESEARARLSAAALPSL